MSQGGIIIGVGAADVPPEGLLAAACSGATGSAAAALAAKVGLHPKVAHCLVTTAASAAAGALQSPLGAVATAQRSGEAPPGLSSRGVCL